LWGQGRKEEAFNIIQKALKTNNKTLALPLEKEQVVLDKDGSEIKNHQDVQSFSILDLFKTPNLRKNTMNICLFW
jgi:hypothetical protein